MTVPVSFVPVKCDLPPVETCEIFCLCAVQCSKPVQPEVPAGGDKPLPVYDGPVDCLTVASSARLVFVRRQVSLSTHAGYKYADWCGLDLWDVSTARCATVLPFGRYGRLLQVDTTPDADRLALLFRAVDDSRYVALIDFRSSDSASGRDPFFAEHAGCRAFVMSPDWHWLATWSPARNEFKLWYVGPKRFLGGDAAAAAANVASTDVVTFAEAASLPTFTLDSQYVVYVDRCDRKLVAYGLREMAPRWRSPALSTAVGNVQFSVRALPVRRHDVMVTCRSEDRSPLADDVGKSFFDDGDDDDDSSGVELRRQRRSPCVATSTSVTIWHLLGGDEGSLGTVVELPGSVGRRRGILDVSKDGLLGVDGLLQVFNLVSGALVTRFRMAAKLSRRRRLPVAPLAAVESSSNSSSSDGSSDEDEHDTGGPRELTRVQLTDDGQYVVWAEKLTVCVGRIADATIVACASTHERPTGLAARLDYGYTIFIGLQDGHVLAARLATSDKGPLRLAAYRPSNFEDRISYLRDMPTCSDETIESFDQRYRIPEKPVASRPNRSSTALPSVGESTKSALLRRADRPHTVLTMMTTATTHSDWPTSDGHKGKRRQRRRRGNEDKTDAVPGAFMKDGSPLLKTGERLKKTAPSMGQVISELVVRVDVNDNTHDQLSKFGPEAANGKVRNETIDENNIRAVPDGMASPSTSDAPVLLRRRIAARRNRGGWVGGKDARDDSGEKKHLRLIVNADQLRRRPPGGDSISLLSAEPPTAGSKTVTPATGTTKMTLSLSSVQKNLLSHGCIRRGSNGGDTSDLVDRNYNDDDNMPMNVNTVTHGMHFIRRTRRSNGEFVQSALESSGKMMLRLCGFDLDKKASSTNGAELDDCDDDENGASDC
jgi:hypothetical protein